MTQFRFLGSAIVIAIITAVGNSWVRNVLLDRLTPLQVSAIFHSTGAIDDLPATTETFVRGAFVESFNLQMRVVLGFSVVGMLTWLLMWQKIQVRIP